jgi:hypothetical protein
VRPFEADDPPLGLLGVLKEPVPIELARELLLTLDLARTLIKLKPRRKDIVLEGQMLNRVVAQGLQPELLPARVAPAVLVHLLHYLHEFVPELGLLQELDQLSFLLSKAFLEKVYAEKGVVLLLEDLFLCGLLEFYLLWLF